jgi:hypothetical protein
MGEQPDIPAHGAIEHIDNAAVWNEGSEKCLPPDKHPPLSYG